MFPLLIAWELFASVSDHHQQKDRKHQQYSPGPPAEVFADQFRQSSSPIAHGQALNNADIAAVAKRYGVTIPQLCIQYTLQLGTVSLPKSSNPNHIKSNVQLDFTITDKDMAVLAGIGQDYGDDSWWPVFSKKKQL